MSDNRRGLAIDETAADLDEPRWSRRRCAACQPQHGPIPSNRAIPGSLWAVNGVLYSGLTSTESDGKINPILRSF